ncbi:hypothetical protein TW81_09820 [Vibrio galatheae]|uniref:Uncharacterized protein n=1 Tax=Vibrio galatheae TaxID=579748 RepID=A0A0F4NMG3_9VIBR|nr:hypothetical protein [Vibrio galatheae]KJY83286.1 hypothetical protein TW81_09820 [Vibrio galatheae]
MDLLERLRTRAEAYLSDPEEVTDEHLNMALEEAEQLAGDSDAPVLIDIAFYRWLLLVDRNGVNDEQIKAYQIALKQITDPQAPQSRTRPTAKTRENPYL